MRHKCSLALFALGIAGVSLHAQDPAVITVNPKVTFQKITGWEATIALHTALNAAFPKYKDTLLSEAVDDLGINRVRLEIRSGAENTRDTSAESRAKKMSAQDWRCYRYATVNDNDDPFTINWAGFQFNDVDMNVEQLLLPMKQRLEARGEKLFINMNYVSFTRMISGPGCPAGLKWEHSNPEEYAEFVLAAYLHLKKKYGLVPDTWEVHLEPDNTDFWRGKQLGEAIVAAAKRLKAHGFKPAFIAPSTTDMSNASPYFDDMIKVPGVLEVLAEFSYHRYRGVSDEVLNGIGERGRKYKVNTSMIEHIASGYEDLHKDLSMGRNSAWSQFGLAGMGAPTRAETDEWIASITGPLVEAGRSGDQKLIDARVANARNAIRDRLRYSGDFGGDYFIVETRDPEKPEVVMCSRTRLLRQYFKFIRAGALRIEARSTDTALDPLAFINVNGGYVVVVKADAGRKFQVNGLPDGVYGIKYTTPLRYDIDLPDVTIRAGQPVAGSIPSAGVVTVYARLKK